MLLANMFNNSVKFIGASALLLCIFSFGEAQELPPIAIQLGQSYKIDDGNIFENVLHISNFECLVEGKNWQRQPACEYYKANLSKDGLPQSSTQSICFKESTNVSYPRQYLAQETYRLKYYSDESRAGHYSDELYHSYETQHPKMKPYPIAAIISEKPMPDKATPSEGFPSGHNRTWQGKPRHAVTDVVLYDCATPYDGKSYN